MEFPTLHSWDVDPAEARALQTDAGGAGRRLDAARPVARRSPRPTSRTTSSATWLYAAVVVVRRGDVRGGRAGRAWSAKATFPYVPGLLSFREAPPVLEAFRRLETRPDVVLCDGQGIAHPRRIGLACHLGPLARPADDRLRQVAPLRRVRRARPRPGRPQPARSTAARSIGAVVRTRARVKPALRLAGPPLRPRRGRRRRPGHVVEVPPARSRPGWPTTTSTRCRRAGAGRRPESA